jgi:hypothetical protein
MKPIKSGQKTLSPTRLMPLMLFITAILALAMSGVAVAKKCDNPPCGGGGGDDPGTHYHVTVTWPELYSVVGGGEYWIARHHSSVDYAPFDPDFIPGSTTGVLNLDFFQDYFGEKGKECFPNISDFYPSFNSEGTSTVDLHGAGTSYKKSTGALARFWFHGYTHTLDPPEEVLYLLSFFKGRLYNGKDWPPVSSNTMEWGKSVELSEWKLRPENEGAYTQANSCVRERGKFANDPADTWIGPVRIEVEIPQP